MIKKIKGTQDFIFSDISQLKLLENKIKIFLELYNYHEIRTPIMEYSEVFHRTAQYSEMVTKETYSFCDKNNRSITLRPEGTAGVIRSYIENKLDLDNCLYKFYYLGPFFRYERPQKGRYRQFHQVGVEILGSDSVFLDLEVISLISEMLKFLGLNNFQIHINTLGDEISYQKYTEVLRNYFDKYQNNLCSLCQNRLINNVLRILDCKSCAYKNFIKKAPIILDYLNIVSQKRFNTVIEGLKLMKINFKIIPLLVRGIDYYSHTVFEIVINNNSEKMNILGGGGCYSHLVKILGGENRSGIGFAFGLERLLSVVQQNGFLKTHKMNQYLDVYFLFLSSELFFISLLLTNQLRNVGVRTEINYKILPLKQQLQKAVKTKPKYFLILGQQENCNNQIILKNVATHEQQVISQCEIVAYLQKELNL